MGCAIIGTMVCIAIVGDPGSGKTATLAYMGVKYYRQGFKLHSNFELFLPQPDGTKRKISHSIKTYKDFNNIRDGYFLGDELWSWIDARMSMSDANMFLSDVLLKARKRHFNLVNTVQHLSQLEKRIRNVTQYVLYPKSIITDPISGERIEIKQDILHPIDMAPYLPYTRIHVFVCVPDPQTGFYDKVVNEFEFPLEPVSKIYNTDEEVDGLMSGDLERGIKEERKFCDFLRTINPDEGNVQIKLIPNSGIGATPISYDVELYIGGVLSNIYDVVTLDKKREKYYYLVLKDKNLKKYSEVEEVRGAKTFFAFRYKDNWYQLPTHHVWNVEKTTVPLTKLLAHCEELGPVT